MITKKEDLINTYIEKGNSTLTNAYLNACAPYIDVHLCRDDKYPEDSHFYFNPSVKHLQSGECDTERYKKLTLSDLKPRTKVEYEKVTESIFDLKDEFCAGLLFTKKFNQEWHQIKTEEQLGNLLSMNDDPTKNGIYRKVERPVEWFDDAVDYINSLDGEATDVDRNGRVKKLYIHAEMDEREAKDFARILLGQ